MNISSILRLRSIAGVTIQTDLTPEQIDLEQKWFFSEPEHESIYNDAVKRKMTDPLLHTLVMAEQIQLTNGVQSITVQRPIPEKPKYIERIIPQYSNDEFQTKDQLQHIVNLEQAGKVNSVMIREPKPSYRLRPSGKKKKPGSTVNKPGSVYNINGWRFNAESSFRGNKTIITEHQAKLTNCHDRPVSEMPVVAERYQLIKNEAGKVQKGIHQEVRVCSHCDKGYIVERDIKITMETMGLFVELNDTYELLTKK